MPESLINGNDLWKFANKVTSKHTFFNKKSSSENYETFLKEIYNLIEGNEIISKLFIELVPESFVQKMLVSSIEFITVIHSLVSNKNSLSISTI